MSNERVALNFPDSSMPLKDRLGWAKSVDQVARKQAERAACVQSSDFVRSELIPEMHAQQVPFIEQIGQIHAAHMRGNEHLIIHPSLLDDCLSLSQAHEINTFGGLIRSENGLPINLDIASASSGASYQDVPLLFQRFGEAMDFLFPSNNYNPIVTEKNIHNYLSVAQFLFNLIHPYVDANGRTSEDMLYVLWMRRPDLAHTMRFISSTGMRDDVDVASRSNLINIGALEYSKKVAVNLGISESPNLSDYRALLDKISVKISKDGKVLDPEELYLRAQTITLVQDLEALQVGEIEPNITFPLLAFYLGKSSETYQLANGQIIGPGLRLVDTTSS